MSMIIGHRSSEENNSENLGVISPDLSFDGDKEVNEDNENHDDLENKILEKIKALKKQKQENSESDKDSEEFDYDSEKLNASIRSDELEEIIKNASTENKEEKPLFVEIESPNKNLDDENKQNDENSEIKNNINGKSPNIELDSPEVLRIIKNIPDELDYLPNEYSEFIQDEDIKI